MVRRVTVVLLLFAHFSVGADDPPPLSPLRIPRVERPPTLADFLTGAPREDELTITDFWQYMPGDGSPVSQPTKAFLSYDDHNIYVGFICHEEKGQLRARVAKREQIMRDDRISICLDTFHDHRHMYWFDVNPYGVQADGNVTDGVEDDLSWDTLWYSDAKITDDGYVVLVTIPFKSIRFPADEEQTWGLIIGRWIVRNHEYSVWPRLSRRRPGFVQQGGDLEGFRNISPGRNLQLIPYGLFARSRYLDTTPGDVPHFRTETDARAGLDAKMVFKDALTLDVTLNPDFSQVESDEPQVTINQRYEVYFPEKRPFFMENGGYFKTPQQLFFSRRIIDPQFGARLTGKMGKWAIGALVVDDQAPGKRVSRSSARRDDRAMLGVVRLQRDLWKNSTVAGMVTSQDFGPAHNRVASADMRLQLLRNWSLVGQAMSSDTRLDDGQLLKGPAYYLQWRHDGKHLVSETWYRDRSPNFRAALGFFDRVDIREAGHTAGYSWRPEGGPVQSYGPVLTAAVNYNRAGQLRDWWINPEFHLEMTRMTRIIAGRYEAFELFGGQGFRWHYHQARARSEWKKWLALEASITAGTGINYFPGSERDPFLARMRRATAGFTLRPTAHARIQETYLYSGLRTDDGTAIFHNHILRSKVNYQFDRRTSVRAIVDYDGTLPNTRLVNLDRSKHLGLDLLFTYMLNPGTALHAGYTDLYDNLRLDPTRSPELYRTASGSLNTGRQFFVKLSYLFRF
ncbi:MAG: carbohydrate binding family 9 domain-containing protein [bacterium]|nr:carbohydrate binding family 9 domain-containing protein [bacterium]